MAVKSLAQSSLVAPTATNSMLAGYSGNQFHHLETIRLGSSASAIEFTNLSRYADYQHLQIRVVARATNATNYLGVRIRLNGDSGTNYFRHELYGEGSGGVVSGGGSSTGTTPFWTAGANATANAFGAGIVDILDAFSSNKNTTVRGLAGLTVSPGSGTLQVVGLLSGGWFNTAALTSIVLEPASSGNFVQNSRFSLYGLKARA
jgi:hypothetical protein